MPAVWGHETLVWTRVPPSLASRASGILGPYYPSHSLYLGPWAPPAFKNGSESESEVAQSCLTLCDPMDCSLPGSSVNGIFKARILEWVAISFSMVLSPCKKRCANS